MQAPRLLLAGACGVGKSTIARSMQDDLALEWIEFDAVTRAMRQSGQRLSLDTYDFAGTILGLLPPPPSGVVLDVGGDSVFRKDADLQERHAQVDRLKTDARLVVVLLEAREDIVRERYLNCGKPSSAARFDEDWDSWVMHMHPHWSECADRIVCVDGPLDAHLVHTVAFG